MFIYVVSAQFKRFEIWRDQLFFFAEHFPHDLLDNFLRSPGPELLVFDCAPEANVFPMVPAGAALSEMMLEEEPS